MIVGRIVEIEVLPGIYRDSDRRINTFKSKSLGGGSYAGADGLENEYDSVCSTGVFASKEYIEFIVERLAEIYFIFIPDGSGLSK